MRLAGKVTQPLLGRELADDLVHLAHAVPGRDHKAHVGGVLDVHAFHKVLQFIPRRQHVLAALDEVCRVKDGLHAAVHLGEDVQAPIGGVAVNALFVLVQKGDAAALGRVHKGAQPLHDLVAVLFRVFPLGDVEAEKTDARNIQEFADFQRPFEELQVGLKGIGN